MLKKFKVTTKKGSEYLATLGFDEDFCKICEGVNHYTIKTNREIESDILEVVDQFGGMVLNRPERKGFDMDEAMVLIEHRNLKDKKNRALKEFKEFVKYMVKINFKEVIDAVNQHNDLKVNVFGEIITESLYPYVREKVKWYEETKKDERVNKKVKELTKEDFQKIKEIIEKTNNRPEITSADLLQEDSIWNEE